MAFWVLLVIVGIVLVMVSKWGFQSFRFPVQFEAFHSAADYIKILLKLDVYFYYSVSTRLKKLLYIFIYRKMFTKNIYIHTFGCKYIWLLTTVTWRHWCILEKDANLSCILVWQHECLMLSHCFVYLLLIEVHGTILFCFVIHTSYSSDLSRMQPHLCQECRRERV